MGGNTTGPSRATPGELRCVVECYRRMARKTILDPTLCVGGPVIKSSPVTEIPYDIPFQLSTAVQLYEKSHLKRFAIGE